MPFQVKHFAPRERGTRLHSHRVLLSLSLSVDRAHLEENATFSSRNISERSFEMMIKRAIARVIAIVPTLRNRGWMEQW